MSDFYMVRAEDLHLVEQESPVREMDESIERIQPLVVLSSQTTPDMVKLIGRVHFEQDISKRSFLNALLQHYQDASEEEQAAVHAAARRWEKERMP